MRILVVGSGGREHALAWRLARDAERPEVLACPGNDGIARSFPCVACKLDDLDGLIAIARDRAVDLVVIGPEVLLAAGLADALEAAGIAAFGPTQAAARLESSKSFTKGLLVEAGVPTPRAESFDELAAARGALERFAPPYALQADGLAA